MGADCSWPAEENRGCFSLSVDCPDTVGSEAQGDPAPENTVKASKQLAAFSVGLQLEIQFYCMK